MREQKAKDEILTVSLTPETTSDCLTSESETQKANQHSAADPDTLRIPALTDLIMSETNILFT